MDKHLHIITHDIPWPVSHGGYMDIYHKIVTLHQLGIKIHLHCFSSGSSLPDELKRYCHASYIYKRIKGISSVTPLLPYIVSSRKDTKLLKNLLKDDHPILFEGIHTTYWLFKNELANRKVVIRLHNVECKYYQQLALHENNIFKKVYYRLESWLLKKYEEQIAGKAIIAAVSSVDAGFYKDSFGANAYFLPVFLPWQEVTAPTGSGCFCLYHGNLSVSENERVAEWLLNEVFNKMEIPLVIAGKDPSLPLQTLAHQQSHTCIVINPSEKEMQDMLTKAHINIIPSFNCTGVKLKLLNALFNGRHCIANAAALKGAETPSCHIANSVEDFREKIMDLFPKPFSEEQKAQREIGLQKVYDNLENARTLIAWIL